jgi:cytochrome c551/c552
MSTAGGFLSLLIALLIFPSISESQLVFPKGCVECHGSEHKIAGPYGDETGQRHTDRSNPLRKKVQGLYDGFDQSAGQQLRRLEKAQVKSLLR